MRNFGLLLLLTILVLTGCSAHQPPVNKNSLEFLGHVRGTFGRAWSGPDGKYPARIASAFANNGIPDSLAVPGIPAPQLDNLESKLNAFAKRHHGSYKRYPSAASLTWDSKVFFPGNGVRGIRPDTYGVLSELAELLNQAPDLLILVYSHDPSVVYNPMKALVSSQENAADFLLALMAFPGGDWMRIASFGSADGEDGTLTLTLLSREFVVHYPVRN